MSIWVKAVGLAAKCSLLLQLKSPDTEKLIKVQRDPKFKRVLDDHQYYGRKKLMKLVLLRIVRNAWFERIWVSFRAHLLSSTALTIGPDLARSCRRSPHSDLLWKLDH